MREEGTGMNIWKYVIRIIIAVVFALATVTLTKFISPTIVVAALSIIYIQALLDIVEAKNVK